MSKDVDEALLREFRRLSSRISAYFAAPAGRRDPALRLGLIDELEQLRSRLVETRDRVGGSLRRNSASRSAILAYGRINRLRG